MLASLIFRLMMCESFKQALVTFSSAFTAPEMIQRLSLAHKTLLVTFYRRLLNLVLIFYASLDEVFSLNSFKFIWVVRLHILDASLNGEPHVRSNLDNLLQRISVLCGYFRVWYLVTCNSFQNRWLINEFISIFKVVNHLLDIRLVTRANFRVEKTAFFRFS